MSDTVRINGRKWWQEKAFWFLLGVVLMLVGVLHTMAMAQLSRLEARQQENIQRAIKTETKVSGMKDTLDEIKADVKLIYDRVNK